MLKPWAKALAWVVLALSLSWLDGILTCLLHSKRKGIRKHEVADARPPASGGVHVAHEGAHLHDLSCPNRHTHSPMLAPSSVNCPAFSADGFRSASYLDRAWNL